MAEKTLLEKLREYDATSFKLPEHKIPLLVWEKKVTKKDQKSDKRLAGVERHNYYYNMNTAECSYFIEDIVDVDDYVVSNYAPFDKAKYTEPRYYVQYIEDLDVLLIGQVSVDVSPIGRGCEPTKRPFGDVGHIYLSRDKKIYYRSYRYSYSTGCTYGDIEEHEKISWGTPVNLSGVIDHSHCGINNESWAEACSDVTKMFNKTCNVGANRMIDITLSPYFFEEFIKYKEPRVRKGPKHDRIQKLCSIPLRDIPVTEATSDKVAFIDKIEDGLCVLRTMHKEEGKENLIDAARIYVSKKEVIACRPNNAGDWINMVLKSNMINWQFDLVDFDADVVKGTMLEYFGEVVKDVPAEAKGRLIFAMLSYPIVESLAKIGFKDFIINTVAKNSYSKAIEPIERIFGKINYGKKKLLDAMGFNKYQFGKICSYVNTIDLDSYGGYYGGPSLVVALKKIFDDEYIPSGGRYYYRRNRNEQPVSISHIDNKTFDKVFEGLLTVEGKTYEPSYAKSSEISTFIDCLAKIRSIYSNQMMLNMIDSLTEIFGKKISVPSRWGSPYEQSMYSIYYDYLDMVEKLGDTAHFRPNFDPSAPQHIQEMHDAAVAVYNLKKDELRNDAFKSVSSRWDKWVYAGEHFSAVAPKIPEDLANEGITLHHCVKSYIDRVIDRRTNIMFIRKNGDLETPFFTVEVSNSGVIEQVHGSCNRNSCTEPGLDDFIKEWSKECKLKTNSYNKVR